MNDFETGSRIPVKNIPAQNKPGGQPKVAKTVSPKKPKKTSLAFKVVMFIVLVLLGASVAGSIFLYNKYTETQQKVEKLSTVQGQQELNKTQVQQLLSKMRTHILLPKDEDPVVATISDIKLLNSNPFYADAKNGDNVVVYAKAKKAFIYSSDKDMIINVGAFEIDNQNTGN